MANGCFAAESFAQCGWRYIIGGMNTSTNDFSYSPSVVHYRLMNELKPALTYQGGDVISWQKQLQAKLIECLGYDKMPADKTPRNVRTLWRREHELGVIEKLVFTSEEGADVPCYLCLPHAAINGPGPVPAFVCLQGHSSGMHNSIGVELDDETKPKDVAGDRDFGIGCMQRGVIGLCVEQRSFGERGEKLQAARGPGMCVDAAMHALMLGRTLAAERVHDVACAVNLLLGRSDVDTSRIGLMGNSGGGTITLFASMVPGITLAMPSCSFCTYKASIMSIHHCVDNYLPGLLSWAESADVAGLYAPRPLVIVAGKDDTIFPIDDARKAFEQVQRIYAAAGAADNVKLVVGPEGHRFYADLAWDAMGQWLK